MQQYLADRMQMRNKFLPLRELSHRSTAKQIRIQQALESRYNRRAIYHLTVAGQNQCKNLEEELLSFPRAINDDASDSAAYQVEIAQPPGNAMEQVGVAEATSYTPRNVGRRLRELENEGVIEVKYVRNHAHYRYKSHATFMPKAAMRPAITN